MDEASVPEGWERFLHKGRIVYSPPHLPNQRKVVIHSRAELSEYHKKGKFLDIGVDQLVFASKRKQNQKRYETKKKDSCLEPQKLT